MVCCSSNRAYALFRVLVSAPWRTAYRRPRESRSRQTRCFTRVARLLTFDVLPLVLDVVHEDVLPEFVRRRVEDPSLVDLRHLVDELLQVVVPVEHERVDRDLLLRRPLHFLER